MFFKITLIFIFLFQISCANENKKSYQDLYALRILLETATKAKPDPVATCQSGMIAMQNCAATAPEFSSFTLTETIFIGSITFNKFLTYSDYCNETVKNDPYRTMSDSLKECYLKCDISYWKTRKNLNICNVSYKTMFEGSFSDSGTSNCKRNCVLPTNNTP
ncbi:MAG: hypothetical protein IPG24_18705 [Leptospiraceae bacterium]|nr:hypothetical protein [Leptospiraceae bacterium]